MPVWGVFVQTKQKIFSGVSKTPLSAAVGRVMVTQAKFLNKSPVARKARSYGSDKECSKGQ